jgi:anti-anti-sigma factor
MNSEGKVLYASHEGIHVLRFVGDIRFSLAPSINGFVDSLFAAAVPKGFVIDLTETRAIDSTSLGVLGRIANRMRESARERVTIVSHRDDINEVLTSMGFDEVFDIVTDRRAALRDGRVLPIEESDRDSLRRSVVEAHRILMALNEHNRELFHELVAALEPEDAKDVSSD